MKKVRIEPGCITCGLCEFIAPDVFEVTDICRVKKDADIATHAIEVEQAVRGCPVAVIVYDSEKKDEKDEESCARKADL